MSSQKTVRVSNAHYQEDEEHKKFHYSVLSTQERFYCFLFIVQTKIHLSSNRLVGKFYIHRNKLFHDNALNVDDYL